MTKGKGLFLDFIDQMGIYGGIEIVYKMQLSKTLDCNFVEYMLVVL